MITFSASILFPPLFDVHRLTSAAAVAIKKNQLIPIYVIYTYTMIHLPIPALLLVLLVLGVLGGLFAVTVPIVAPSI